jgi:hypothetical protein
VYDVAFRAVPVAGSYCYEDQDINANRGENISVFDETNSGLGNVSA